MKQGTPDKEKIKTGTILKVPTGDFEFSKDELNELWNAHNSILKDFEQPAERYTRNLSDLIKSFRDVSEKLILAGAIPNLTKKDTASYVKKHLTERNVPLSHHFYQYFSAEQKRDWQTEEVPKVISENFQGHKHEFIFVKNDELLGEIKRCECTAIMIEGRPYEAKLEPDEIDKIKSDMKATSKEQLHYEEENEPLLAFHQRNIEFSKSAIQKYSHNPAMSKLTVEEKDLVNEELWTGHRTFDLAEEVHDDRQSAPEYVQHLLEIAVIEVSKSHAAGLYVSKFKEFGAEKRKVAVKKMIELLSSKQTVKIMKGLVPFLHPRYEPKDKDEANNAGFMGIQCPTCKHWRVNFDRVRLIDTITKETKWDTKLYCYRCKKAIEDYPAVPLPLASKAIVIEKDWES